MRRGRGLAVGPLQRLADAVDEERFASSTRTSEKDLEDRRVLENEGDVKVSKGETESHVFAAQNEVQGALLFFTQRLGRFRFRWHEGYR